MGNRNKQSLWIIGPLPPIRGGIPIHTQTMAEQFAQQGNTVMVLAPKRLYPRWLYPGSTPPKTDAVTTVEKADFINSSKIGISARILFSTPPRIAIIPVWTWYLYPWCIIWSKILRLRRVKVLHFYHNVIPHDSGKIGKLAARFVSKTCDEALVQNESELEKFHELSPGKSARNVGKPPSRKSTIVDADRLTASKLPGTLLFIGLLKEYKNVVFLIRSFKLIEDEKIKLRIVGEVWSKGLEKKIREESTGDSRVELVLNYVSENQFVEEIKNASYVVLPYTEATGSAILETSLSYGTPVLVSNIKPFRERVTEGVDGFFLDISDVRSLQKILEERNLIQQIQPRKTSFESRWGTFVKVALEGIE